MSTLQIDEPNGRQTEYLLRCIANRLSGREDCKHLQYKVSININGVSMEPLVYVYKNRYKRQETDKLDIVSFVHDYRMNGAKLSDFVFGTYQYQMSSDGKRRKWIKID